MNVEVFNLFRCLSRLMLRQVQLHAAILHTRDVARVGPSAACRRHSSAASRQTRVSHGPGGW